MVMRACFLVCVVACTDSVVVVPVIDGPTDSDSAAFPDLDTIELTVAHQGSADDLVSATFTRGQPLELTDVPFADDLVIHMSGQIGGSDIAYGRTCSFALDATDPPPTPHLFFSRTVKFAALATQAESRTDGIARTYHDGSALMMGGSAAGAPVIDVEHFDPRLGTLTVLSQQVAPRNGAVAAALGTSDPPIALIGGDFTSPPFYEVLEVDGVRVDNFPDTTMARDELTATTLTDGRIIVVGGVTPAGPTSAELDELSSATGTPTVQALRAVLAHPRSGHTATRLGDDVGAPILIVGGIDDTAEVPIAELFKPLADDLADPATFAPAMIVPRFHHHASLMPDGSVLIIGGTTFAGAPVTKLELFSLDTGFVDVGDLPAEAGIVDFTATTLPDGRILLAGGRVPGGPPLDTAFIAQLDPVDGSVDVVATDRLAVPRAGHQATLMCDGTVLVSGGTAGPALVERYNPPALDRR